MERWQSGRGPSACAMPGHRARGLRRKHGCRPEFAPGMDRSIKVSSHGEVAEWSNAPDSKSGLRFYRNVGSNPTLSARNKKRPSWAFCVSAEGWCGQTHRVRQIRLERIWTAEGWPRAQRGVRLMDEPSNPTLSARNKKRPFHRPSDRDGVPRTAPASASSNVLSSPGRSSRREPR